MWLSLWLAFWSGFKRGVPPDAIHARSRSQYKARKYRKLLDSGAIPQHIAEAIENCPSRNGKRKLINQLFIKDESGSGIVVASDVYPKRYKLLPELCFSRRMPTCNYP